MDNANSKEYLDKILIQVLENLKRTTHAPSVQMQDVPRESMAMNDEDEAALDDLDEDENPDRRTSQRKFDKYVEKDGELSESEDEEMAESNGVRKQPGSRKRRNIINYKNLNDFGDSGVDSAMGTPQAGSSLPDDNDEMNVDPTPADKRSPAVEQTNGSTTPSAAHSPQAKLDEDVTMGEADEPSGEAANGNSELGITKTDAAADTSKVEPSASSSDNKSTSPGLTQVKTEMAADDAAIAAQEEGIREREEDNAAGQARTKIASTVL
jgi:histone deacetylase 1/2